MFANLLENGFEPSSFNIFSFSNLKFNVLFLQIFVQPLYFEQDETQGQFLSDVLFVFFLVGGGVVNLIT